MLLAQMVVEYVADVTKLTAGVTAATDSMVAVGAATDTVGASMADFSGAVDLGALSLEEFNTYMAGACEEFGLYADGTSIAADTTNTLAASMDRLSASTDMVDTSLAATSVSADSAAVSFDALAVAEDVAATAGDAIEASLAAVGTALAVVGIGAGIVGVVSAKMAGDFQQSMTQLQTGAGESADNLQMVSDGILNMAGTVGTSTSDLTAGMYMIESAGYHGADGLAVLKDAAEGAKVGAASLADVANGVTTEMTDYASSGLTASEATNTLIATVADGKTHMADLANAMATILPTASSVGVSLTDTSAAMATMTSEGVPAADAATYLRQTIMQLENPTKKAADEMSKMGLKSSDVANEMKKSLPDALQMITDAAAKKFPVGSQQYNDAVATMAGGTKSLQGMLDLTGQHMDTFKNDVADISGKVKAGGDSINGWAKVQGDFNFKMDQAKGTLQSFGIQIGNLILPQLGKLLDAFNSPEFKQFATGVLKDIYNGFKSVGDFVGPLIPKFKDIASNFAKVTDAFKDPAIQKLADEIGGDLKRGIEWLVNALASPQFGDFMHLVGEGIAGAIQFVIPLVIEITKNVVKFAEDVYNRVKPKIDEFFKWWKTNWPGIAMALQGVWDNIKGIVQIAWALISGWIKIGLDILTGNWGQAWNDMKDMLKGVWEGIKTYLKGAWEDIKAMVHLAFGKMGDDALKSGENIVKSIGTGISNGFHWVKDAIGNVVKWIADHLPHSPAKMGPLVDLEQSGMQISNQIAKGMINGAPLINSATSNLVKPITVGLKGTASTGGSGGQTITIIDQTTHIVQVDGKQLAKVAGKGIQKELRGHGLKK